MSSLVFLAGLVPKVNAVGVQVPYPQTVKGQGISFKFEGEVISFTESLIL
jgi:hypothetical protein